MAVDNINDLTKNVAEINDYVKTKMAQNAFSSDSPIGNSNIAGLPSPLDYINYFKLVANKLDSPEGAFFLAKEGLLKSMNPVLGMGKLYNPASALSPPPFAAGEVTDFLESPVASANQTENLILREDRLKAMSEGRYNDTSRVGTMDMFVQVNQFRYPDQKSVQQKINDNNAFSVDFPMDKNQYIENANWQDQGLDGRKTVEKLGVQYDVPDYSKIFDLKKNGPSFKDGVDKGTFFFKPKIESRQRINIDPDSFDWVANQDTFFSQADFEKGYSEEEFQDAELYVPFYFVDLRKTNRKILFRAFLDNFSESITPKWMQEEFFGRVDPVVTYKSTGRSVNISFKIMPLSPPGFTAMWRKMNQFVKTCYPSFRNGSMVRSPVIRMRIGDVVADATGQGLPGYIDKLELNYTNSVWETQSYNGPSPTIELGKAPMKIEVSLTFIIIHEQNPGLDDDYGMDMSTFRRIGASQPEASAAAENFTLEETTQSPETEPGASASPPPESIV